jgi:hypothetical protein
VGHHQRLELRPDLGKTVVDRLECASDVLAFLLSFDLLHNVETFFEEGGTDGLGGGDGPAWTEESAVDAFPDWEEYG